MAEKKSNRLVVVLAHPCRMLNHQRKPVSISFANAKQLAAVWPPISGPFRFLSSTQLYYIWSAIEREQNDWKTRVIRTGGLKKIKRVWQASKMWEKIFLDISTTSWWIAVKMKVRQKRKTKAVVFWQIRSWRSYFCSYFSTKYHVTISMLWKNKTFRGLFSLFQSGFIDPNQSLAV